MKKNNYINKMKKINLIIENIFIIKKICPFTCLNWQTRKTSQN